MSLIKYFANGGPVIGYVQQRTPYVPGRGAVSSSSAKSKKDDSDYEYNPGDSQWISDKEIKHDNALRNLFAEHGYNIQAAYSDPKFAQISSILQGGVADHRAADINFENRKNITARMNAGEINPGNYKLTYNRGWELDKPYIDPNSRNVNAITKGQDLDLMTEQPVLDQNGNITVHEFDMVNEKSASKDLTTELGNHFNAVKEAGLDYGKSYEGMFGDPSVAKKVGKIFYYMQEGVGGGHNFKEMKAGVKAFMSTMPADYEYVIAQRMFKEILNNGEVTVIKKDKNGNAVQGGDGRFTTTKMKVSPEELFNDDGSQNKGFINQLVDEAAVSTVAEFANSRRRLEQRGVETTKIGEYRYDTKTGRIIDEDEPTLFWWEHGSGEAKFPDAAWKEQAIYTRNPDGTYAKNETQNLQVPTAMKGDLWADYYIDDRLAKYFRGKDLGKFKYVMPEGAGGIGLPTSSEYLKGVLISKVNGIKYGRKMKETPTSAYGWEMPTDLDKLPKNLDDLQAYVSVDVYIDQDHGMDINMLRYIDEVDSPSGQKDLLEKQINFDSFWKYDYLEESDKIKSLGIVEELDEDGVNTHIMSEEAQGRKLIINKFDSEDKDSWIVKLLVPIETKHLLYADQQSSSERVKKVAENKATSLGLAAGTQGMGQPDAQQSEVDKQGVLINVAGYNSADVAQPTTGIQVNGLPTHRRSRN